MTATIITEVTYPLTDTATGDLNSQILKQEFEDASLSVSVSDVSLSGTNFIVKLYGLATSADITSMNSVVASHQGDEFISPPLSEFQESETSDDSGNEVTKVTMETGPLAAGIYIVGWHMEHSTTSTTGSTASKAIFSVEKNGESETERSSTSNGEHQYKTFAASLSVGVNAGDSYIFRLKHKRIGDSGNASKVRRARITFVRV